MKENKKIKKLEENIKLDMNLPKQEIIASNFECIAGIDTTIEKLAKERARMEYKAWESLYEEFPNVKGKDGYYNWHKKEIVFRKGVKKWQ